jgi:predicted metal-dependent phosphoesterase TrpH/glycosyltransferase involved in cell wall biosynthesis
MGLRVALVTPFSWSQPHDVNEHVAGLAGALRARGHSVTVLAPSNRPRDLADGRRTLARSADAELIALGPALPIARGTRLGVPVGVRANLAVALGGAGSGRGAFDVVHGFEPGLPSLSYLALRDSTELTAATFLSAERLGYPPGRAQRERLLGRLDALLATSEETAQAAALRFPGRYELVPSGVDLDLFAPSPKRDVVVLEWRQAERPLLRALVRELAVQTDWDLVLLRTRPLGGRPALPRILRGRVRVRTALDAESRAAVLRDAAVFVPAFDGLPRIALEAQAAGAAVSAPQGRALQPELAAAETARLIEDATFRSQRVREGLEVAKLESFGALAERVEAIYASLERRRRPVARPAPLEERDWIVVDLHMHTTWSHDCSIEVDDLLDHAQAEGLGAIAVTDHNVLGGALEAVEKARGRRLIVIPGEEVKTATEGEVIGLFLEEEIPRGMSFAETVAAIRAQGGLVYVPHPFDRLHAIPDAATLHRHLGEIDIFEVYNARLLFEGYNVEALRFARKYNLTAAAGSDAHVLQGVGTGAVRMRRFQGPEEFLLSLRSADILRRPKSLAYLQGLKWVAQAKERVR